jgi:LCP family protein required for cell wall assembly
VLVAVLSGAAIGGAYWFANEKLDKADRRDLDLPEPQKGEPTNFLVIGSDTRAIVDDAAEAEHFGAADEQTGQRSDTIMVVHVDPDAETGLLVSFPRDLWVEIPGVGGAKLNAAFNAGPKRVVETLQQNFDFKINHYLEVNFDTFRDLVGAVGDVPIFFPFPARDKWTGLMITEGGCRPLDGEQSLQYVRAREYEQQQEDGDWHADPTADLGRIQRQQYFIRSLADKAISAGFRNPTKINSILNKAFDNLVIDDGLSLQDLLRLAKTFRQVDPGVVEMVTLPTTRQFIGDQDAQVLEPVAAAPLLDRLRTLGDTAEEAPPNVAPAEISVSVRNGSGVGGQARAVLDALGDLGFETVEPPSNADRRTTTEVRFGPGDEAKAQVVLANLGGAGELFPMAEGPSDVDVQVILGLDFEAVGPTPTTAPPTTAPQEATTVPTTAAGQTATTAGADGRPAAGC